MLGPRAAQKDSPHFGGFGDVPVSPEDEVELIEVDLSQTTGDDTFSVQHAFPRDLNLKIVRSQYMISTYSLNSANGASVLTYRGGSRSKYVKVEVYISTPHAGPFGTGDLVWMNADKFPDIKNRSSLCALIFKDRIGDFRKGLTIDSGVRFATLFNKHQKNQAATARVTEYRVYNCQCGPEDSISTIEELYNGPTKMPTKKKPRLSNEARVRKVGCQCGFTTSELSYSSYKFDAEFDEKLLLIRWNTDGNGAALGTRITRWCRLGGSQRLQSTSSWISCPEGRRRGKPYALRK
jgi:hypothetical protein